MAKQKKKATKRKSQAKVASAARSNRWLDSHEKYAIKQFDDPKQLSLVEVSYRLNKKYPETPRNTASVSQRLVALRRGGVKMKKRAKTMGPGYVSEEAKKFMAKLDVKYLERLEERKAEKATPRRSYKKRDQVSAKGFRGDDETKVFTVDLGSKGSIKMEISGPILLDDDLMGSLSGAMSKALTA